MGNSNKSGDENGVACPVPRPPDLSGVTRVTLDSRPPLRNHAEAVALANAEADGGWRIPCCFRGTTAIAISRRRNT